jgi:hypothetical protein
MQSQGYGVPGQAIRIKEKVHWKARGTEHLAKPRGVEYQAEYPPLEGVRSLLAWYRTLCLYQTHFLKQIASTFFVLIVRTVLNQYKGFP